MFILCMARNPQTVSIRIRQTYDSLKYNISRFASFIFPRRSPPSAYYIMILKGYFTLLREKVSLPQLLSLIIDEGFSVGDYIWMVDACEDAYFIDSVAAVFFTHSQNLCSFHRVQHLVPYSLHQIHLAITTCTKFFDRLEVIKLS